jgi:hypothetical protein
VSELFQRIGLAFKCFFVVLFAGRLPGGIPRRYRTGILEEPDEVGPGSRAGDTAGGVAAARTRRAEPTGPAAASTAPRAAPGASQPFREGGPDRAVQLLALFQRDGRLVDFLREDIAGYPDDQVGAAVREVHAACRRVLDDYFTLEPVMPGEEGRPTVVEPGFDLACVKLVGSVTGKPPFRGVLRHKGWRARRVDLPSVPGDAGLHVIAPAEVEIG